MVINAALTPLWKPDPHKIASPKIASRTRKKSPKVCCLLSLFLSLTRALSLTLSLSLSRALSLSPKVSDAEAAAKELAEGPAEAIGGSDGKSGGTPVAPTPVQNGAGAPGGPRGRGGFKG